MKLPVVQSLGLHLSFVVLLVALGQAEFMARRELLRENIQLVEASVRVDLVAMPVETLQELRAISEQAAAPAPAPEPVAPPAPAKPSPPVASQAEIEAAAAQREFLIENEKAKALEEQKAQERERERIAREQEAESENFMNFLRQASSQEASQDSEPARRVDPNVQRRLQDLVLRGNKVSEGVALVGGGSGEVSSEFVSYLQGLPDRVRPHWRLPSYLVDQGYQCRVRVFISDSGRLIRAELYETSGNDEYDRRALEAVRSASPFPALGEGFAHRGVRGDIVLGFPL